jgi:tetratricopeptide (TPR) repeat protein
LENARDDLKEAEKHGPLNPEGQYALATLRELRGEYAAAIKQYERLLAIDGVKAYGHGRLARVFATAADAEFRDGKRAMEHAQAVCALSKFQAAMPLSYLAAAHAENGDFAAAVRWQTKAVALADDFDRKELTKQLELYKAGKPYRQTPNVRVAAMPK